MSKPLYSSPYQINTRVWLTERSRALGRSRWDMRRQLLVEEANAIGTAYLRLDVLPSDAKTWSQPGCTPKQEVSYRWAP